MKGILLAGGTGSRLMPLTKWTNKHLLPVFDEPMVFRPLQTLKECGITDILVVTGPEYSGEFINRLGSGAEHGVNFTYLVQEKPKGIADGILLAEHFCEKEPVLVVLGDNFFAQNEIIAEQCRMFRTGAEIFVTESKNPSAYGVVTLSPDGNVQKVEEKPVNPTTNLVQTGAYMYDATVFDRIKSLTPSERGELEVSDLNQLYANENKLKGTKIEGDWYDCGTHADLLKASSAYALLKKQIEATPDALNPQEFPHVTVGLVTWNSAEHIADCLNTILAEPYPNKQIFVWDNNSKDKTKQILKEFQEKHAIKTIFSPKNIGFGAAHNQILNQTSGEYYFCLNPDTLLEGDTISALVADAKVQKMAGAICPKIKRLEKGNKTNFLDSTGVDFYQNFMAYDANTGQADKGQAQKAKEVFGFTGAAVLFRRKTLEDVAHRYLGQVQYFDEAFFAYKEDIDLSYRIRMAGWRIWYTAQSVLFHRRTAREAPKNVFFQLSARIFGKSQLVNRLGYRNQRLLMVKHLRNHKNWAIQRKTWWFQLKVLVFLFIFETETLLEWKNILKKWKEVRVKATQMPKRVDVGEIESWMK